MSLPPHDPKPKANTKSLKDQFSALMNLPGLFRLTWNISKPLTVSNALHPKNCHLLNLVLYRSE